MSTLDEVFQKTDAQLAALADKLLEQVEFPPSTPLKSQKQVRQEAHELLTNILTAKDLRHRVKNGCKHLMQDLPVHTTPALLEQMQHEWKLYAEQPFEPPTSTQENPPQEVCVFSQESIDAMYACGAKLYEAKHAQEAADVFLTIAFLDSRRPNVWLAFGLAEKAQQHWASALYGFSMACVLDPTNHRALIHSAECFLATGQKPEALECLQAASALLEKKTDKESQKSLTYISNLKRSSQQKK